MATQDPTRNWTAIPQTDAAQVQRLKVTDLLTGPAIPMLRTEGDPNGTLTGQAGQLALDYNTGTIWQNQDDATTWAVYITGGGGATVTTAAPITGDGSALDPVTYVDVLGQCLIGNPNEAVLAKPSVLTTTVAGGMLANKVAVSVDAATMEGTGLTAVPLKARGSFLGTQMFTASGTYTPTAGTRKVFVRMVGGGSGGGGAVSDATFVKRGAGGGSGVYVEKSVVAAPGLFITGGAVVIGAGGAGGTPGNAGTQGGDTTVVIQGTTYTARRGVGGQAATAGAASGVTQGGGNFPGSNGDVNVRGTSSESAAFWITSALGMSGAGGSNPLGGGGSGSTGTVSATGAAGSSEGFGGGGAGGVAAAASVDASGGAGAPGVVIIDEYT